MWIKGHFLVSVLRFFPTNFKVGLTTQKIILTQTVNASFFQKTLFLPILSANNALDAA